MVHPSSRDHLGISLPMTVKISCLAWSDSRRDEEAPGSAYYKDDEIGHPMHIPGNDSYIGHLHVCGNLLRGRQCNENAFFVWYINKFRPVQNLIVHRTVYGT
jgi:hypothetical protein